MFRLDSSSTNPLGPQKAAELLRINNFVGQRPLNRSHVGRLIELMKLGQFVKANIAVGEDPKTGHKYLMNGQHQLTAIQESGLVVKATIDYYKVDEESDFSKLFATFDTNRPRTSQHILHAARPLMADERLRNMPLRLLQNVTSALYILRGDKPDFTSTKAPLPTAKVDLAEDCAEEVVWIHRLFAQAGVGDSVAMPTVGVIVAILATSRASQPKAEEFWLPVLSSANLEKGSPQWSLNRWLNSGGNRGAEGSTRRFVEAVTCVCWWNSWINGETRRSVKTASISEMPRVLGRPARLVQA